MTKKEVTQLYLWYKNKDKSMPADFLAGMKHTLILLNVPHNELE